MPDAAHVETMARELIATGTMWPETVADLERFIAEAKEGTLSDDDYRYLVAFHAKNVLEAGPEAVAAEPAEDWRHRAERAEEKLQAIRRRFAELYDPAGNPERASEQVTRGEVFAEFRSELD